MVYVVRIDSGEIIFRMDAWAINSVEKAEAYAREHGFDIAEETINVMGDMEIWVI